MSRAKESRVEEGVTQWRCSACKRWLQAEGFYPRKSARNGLTSECRSCNCDRRALALGYALPHRSGSMPLSGPRRMTAFVQLERAEVGPGKCVICEEPLSGRRRVLCGDEDCARTYNTMAHLELRARRSPPEPPLPSGR